MLAGPMAGLGLQLTTLEGVTVTCESLADSAVWGTIFHPCRWLGRELFPLFGS